MERLSSNELLKLLDKQWANTEDIKKIGCVGRNKALKIKKEIQTQATNDGCFLPKDLVPMQYVIDYFPINIKYLKKISNYSGG